MNSFNPNIPMSRLNGWNLSTRWETKVKLTSPDGPDNIIIRRIREGASVSYRVKPMVKSDTSGVQTELDYSLMDTFEQPEHAVDYALSLTDTIPKDTHFADGLSGRKRF